MLRFIVGAIAILQNNLRGAFRRLIILLVVVVVIVIIVVIDSLRAIYVSCTLLCRDFQ